MIKKEDEVFNFIENKIKILEKTKKRITNWKIFISIFISLINISIICISSYIINALVIKFQNDTDINKNFFNFVGPTILISITTILSFIITILILIYRSNMKANIYKLSMEKIQHYYISYINNENDLRDKDYNYFKFKVSSEYKKAIKENPKVNFKSVIKKTLVGDK